MADRRFRNRAWTKDAQGFSVAQAEFLKAAKMLLNMLAAFVYEALHREGFF